MRPSSLWILGVVVLGLAGLGLWVFLRERAIEQSLAASERAERSLYDAFLARDDRRPTLGEAQGDGDARLVYEDVLPRIAALEAQEEQSDELGILHWYSQSRFTYCDWMGLADDGTPPAEQVRRYVEQTRPLLDRLRPVLALPRLGREVKLGFPPPDGEDAEAWQALNDLVSLHVLHDVAQGQVDDAIDLCVLRWFAAWDRARGGSTLSFVQALYLAQGSIADLRRILADGPVEAERLDRLAREVAFLREQKQSLRDAYRADEMYFRHGLREEAAKAGLLASDRAIIADALDRVSVTREAFDRATEGKYGPESEAAADALFESLDKKANPIFAMFFVIYSHAVGRLAQLEGMEDLLQTGIALARYRAANGRLPDALGELVPTFLAEVPIDRWSGAPLRYDGEKLWAVGTDGVDQQGEEPLQFDDGMREDGDVVFTLYTDDVRSFPWPEGVDVETREQAEAALRVLLEGECDPAEAEASLAGLGYEIAGRLVGAFAAIEAQPGFDTPEGRRRVAAIDRVLRRIDGFMECRWLSWETEAEDETAARRTAVRWTNWQRRKAWRRGALTPWESEDLEEVPPRGGASGQTDEVGVDPRADPPAR